MKPPNTEAITHTLARHPLGRLLRFELVRQDRRWYYRCGCCLTDEAHALGTVAYWRARGWVEERTP